MKYFLFFISFFTCIDLVFANDVYISKRDIVTGDYIVDCDFLLIDSSGNIVDSWIQNYSDHISYVNNGFYKLVSRPYVMGTFNDSMSSIYLLDVNNSVIRFTIYDDVIDTPNNLGFFSNSLFYGFLFIIFGLFLIFVNFFSNRHIML